MFFISNVCVKNGDSRLWILRVVLRIVTRIIVQTIAATPTSDILSRLSSLALSFGNTQIRPD